MKIITEFPRPIREVENVWVPMPDGCRLSARMWLPADAEEQPVPALLYYPPYRSNDLSLPRLAPNFAYLAGHGYAAISVDARGTGESDGLIADEYSEQELADGVAAIAWLADQQWCTGAVGIWGISWTGQNALQIAAMRPPQLRAIISLGATDDLYNDGEEYMGGCVLGRQLDWTASVHALMAQPPQPWIVGERWRDMWRERVEQMASFLEYRLAHQRRDAYWKRGSVCEDYGAITCAVYLIGGWADGFVNTVTRFLSHYAGPKKGLIGPWGHGLSHDGGPAPNIGFHQECLRWWDQWLKGIDTGVMDEPVLRAYVQESIEPRVSVDVRPGRWVAETVWPSPRIEPRTYALNPGALAEEAGSETPLAHRSPLHVGQHAGPWLVGARATDFPPDQREDDALSLCFDSEPLAAPVDILGQPEVALAVASDRPSAMIAVRLCDLRPDGSSLLITRGLLNLTHRDSHEHPTPLEPGKRYDVVVRLRAIGQMVPAGHRLRLAISTSYWPFAWPSPEPATLTFFVGPACHLTLPTRPSRTEDAHLPAFAEPENGPPLQMEVLRSFEHTWTTGHDFAAGRYETAFLTNGGRRRFTASGIEYGFSSNFICTIVEGDPLSARVRCERGIDIARGDWRTRVELSGDITADATTFRVTMDLGAYEGHARIATKTWNLAIPRDLV